MMMMEDYNIAGRRWQPLVSIITPVYNGHKYLEELIESVREQDYPCIEHIIIDDGSTDEGATVAILKRYPHLRWWSRPNKGSYATINEGLLASTGELVTVICADDKYAGETAISSAVKCMTSYKQCDAVYGETIMMNEKSCVLDTEPPVSGPLWFFRYYPIVCHCSLLLKRSVIINKDCFFDTTFPYAADHVWIIQLIQKGCVFRRLRKPIAMFRVHATQRSQDNNPIRIDEQKRIIQMYGDVNRTVFRLVHKWRQLAKLKQIFFRYGWLGCLSAVVKRQNS